MIDPRIHNIRKAINSCKTVEKDFDDKCYSLYLDHPDENFRTSAARTIAYRFSKYEEVDNWSQILYFYLGGTSIGKAPGDISSFALTGDLSTNELRLPKIIDLSLLLNKAKSQNKVVTAVLVDNVHFAQVIYVPYKKGSEQKVAEIYINSAQKFPLSSLGHDFLLGKQATGDVIKPDIFLSSNETNESWIYPQSGNNCGFCVAYWHAIVSLYVASKGEALEEKDLNFPAILAYANATPIKPYSLINATDRVSAFSAAYSAITGTQTAKDITEGKWKTGKPAQGHRIRFKARAAGAGAGAGAGGSAAMEDVASGASNVVDAGETGVKRGRAAMDNAAAATDTELQLALLGKRSRREAAAGAGVSPEDENAIWEGVDSDSEGVESDSGYKGVESDSEYEGVESDSEYESVESDSEYESVESDSKYERVTGRNNFKSFERNKPLSDIIIAEMSERMLLEHFLDSIKIDRKESYINRIFTDFIIPKYKDNIRLNDSKWEEIYFNLLYTRHSSYLDIIRTLVNDCGFDTKHKFTSVYRSRAIALNKEGFITPLMLIKNKVKGCIETNELEAFLTSPIAGRGALPSNIPVASETDAARARGLVVTEDVLAINYNKVNKRSKIRYLSDDIISKMPANRRLDHFLLSIKGNMKIVYINKLFEEYIIPKFSSTINLNNPKWEEIYFYLLCARHASHLNIISILVNKYSFDTKHKFTSVYGSRILALNEEGFITPIEVINNKAGLGSNARYKLQALLTSPIAGRGALPSNIPGASETDAARARGFGVTEDVSGINYNKIVKSGRISYLTDDIISTLPENILLEHFLISIKGNMKFDYINKLLNEFIIPKYIDNIRLNNPKWQEIYFNLLYTPYASHLNIISILVNKYSFDTKHKFTSVYRSRNIALNKEGFVSPLELINNKTALSRFAKNKLKAFLTNPIARRKALPTVAHGASTEAAIVAGGSTLMECAPHHVMSETDYYLTQLVAALNNSNKKLAIEFMKLIGPKGLCKQDREGITLLMQAIRAGDKEIALALIDNMNPLGLAIKNSFGATALTLAVSGRHIDIAKVLISNMSTDALSEPYPDGYTILMKATEVDDKEVALALIQRMSLSTQGISNNDLRASLNIANTFGRVEIAAAIVAVLKRHAETAKELNEALASFDALSGVDAVGETGVKRGRAAMDNAAAATDTELQLAPSGKRSRIDAAEAAAGGAGISAPMEVTATDLVFEKPLDVQLRQAIEDDDYSATLNLIHLIGSEALGKIIIDGKSALELARSLWHGRIADAINSALRDHNTSVASQDAAATAAVRVAPQAVDGVLRPLSVPAPGR